MKIKYVFIMGSTPLLSIMSLMLFFVMICAGSSTTSSSSSTSTGYSLSDEVLAHQETVEKYAEKYGIEDYVYYILAIMQVESGGVGNDVMQSSESLGLPVNSLDTESSIEQGCKYFSQLLEKANAYEISDINVVIQSYNYGSGYIDYVAKNGNEHTFELAQEFSKEKSNGEKVSYVNTISTSMGYDYRYNYGNMFYVELVNQYLIVTKFDDETVQMIMDEALKYEGWEYVYGGSNPNTSFDCSGLTQWCYGVAGITLPRTAQQQYDSDNVQHIPYEEAEAGDLIFFHSTYDTADYITHVAIYVGNGKMYHAGDPIGYAVIDDYWLEHMVCVGRIKE